MSRYQKESILPLSLFEKITDVRVSHPDTLLETAKKRKRRDTFTHDGKINIIAADHPARGSISVGKDNFVMADRHDLLARLVYVLQSEWVDGVLGSMDVLEELLILQQLIQDEGEPGFLDEKLLIVSLNRGGLSGSVWELNDPITGTDASTCVKFGIDASKMLLRIDFSAPDSLKTMEYCAKGISDMNMKELPVFLEPLPVVEENQGYRIIRDAELLMKLVSVASALGNSSRNMWLKVPYTEDFQRVTAATTLPLVLLGGDRNPDMNGLTELMEKSMAAGHQVRGAMFGRNVLYPESADPFETAELIGRLVHGNVPYKKNDVKPVKFNEDLVWIKRK